MAGAGAPDGSYRLGGESVQVSKGQATLEDGTLAGSTLTLDSALRNAVLHCNLSVQDAIAAVTEVPAKALGVDAQYGRIEVGRVADVVIFDEAFNVQAVWAAGRLVAESGP
jgi:N-acetylglucosamine-6-phosphate deacetylase